MSFLCPSNLGLQLSFDLHHLRVSDVSQKTVANLGWTDIKMTYPLYVGDTLYAESEVIEKRESKSRPDEGIVTVRTIGKNQDGVEVATSTPS